MKFTPVGYRPSSSLVLLAALVVATFVSAATMLPPDSFSFGAAPVHSALGDILMVPLSLSQ